MIGKAEVGQCRMCGHPVRMDALDRHYRKAHGVTDVDGPPPVTSQQAETTTAQHGSKRKIFVDHKPPRDDRGYRQGNRGIRGWRGRRG